MMVIFLAVLSVSRALDLANAHFESGDNHKYAVCGDIPFKSYFGEYDSNGNCSENSRLPSPCWIWASGECQYNETGIYEPMLDDCWRFWTRHLNKRFFRSFGHRITMILCLCLFEGFCCFSLFIYGEAVFSKDSKYMCPQIPFVSLIFISLGTLMYICYLIGNWRCLMEGRPCLPQVLSFAEEGDYMCLSPYACSLSTEEDIFIHRVCSKGSWSQNITKQEGPTSAPTEISPTEAPIMSETEENYVYTLMPFYLGVPLIIISGYLFWINMVKQACNTQATVKKREMVNVGLFRTIDFLSDFYFYQDVVASEKEKNIALFYILTMVVISDFFGLVAGYFAAYKTSVKFFMALIFVNILLELCEIPAVLIWDFSGPSLFAALLSFICLIMDFFIIHFTLNDQELKKIEVAEDLQSIL